MHIRRLILPLLFLYSFSANSEAGIKNKPIDTQKVYWYENGVKQYAWPSADEFAVFSKKSKGKKTPDSTNIKKLYQKATVKKSNKFFTLFKLKKDINQKAASSKLVDNSVFYSNKNKNKDSLIIPTGELVVIFPPECSEDKIKSVENQYKLEKIRNFSFDKRSFLYKTTGSAGFINLANSLYESGKVLEAYPNYLKKHKKKFIPNDPLFSEQWNLYNTGQGNGLAGEDSNITPVWDRYKGTVNEVIAIVDDGLEINHEDLVQNILPGISWDFIDGNSDPNPGGNYDKHGTACAGIAAGRGSNGLGITGVAPMSALVGLRLLGVETTANEADALSWKSDVVDIYSNSWGPVDTGKVLDGPSPLTRIAIKNSIMTGRGGLGNIYVWAAGNGGENDNSNYDGYANSRYTIAVAATTNTGILPWYGERGANILINAPSNGGTMGIATTDRTGGAYGYNCPQSGDPGYDPLNPPDVLDCAGNLLDKNYTNNFGGTSAAAPIVSGVVALMLEANPSLTWRDVQHILAKTAVKNHPTDEGWTTNGAQYNINHKYGFGRIDAAAAVTMARTWVSVADEVVLDGNASLFTYIPDGDVDGINSSISISANINIEFVEVFFSAVDHPNWGDLKLTLTSPDGTESILAEMHDTEGTSDVFNNWKFGSVRYFGEESEGDWILNVKDLVSGNTGTFQFWSIKIYGTYPPPELAVSPSTYTFGSVSMPTNKSFEIKNMGGSNLFVNSIYLDELSSNDFSIANDRCSSKVLIPGGLCHFDIAFAAESYGYNAGSVLISSNDTSNPLETISLSATALDTTAPFSSAYPEGGTYNHELLVGISCNDGLGSGCSSIHYCLGEACTPDILYEERLSIPSGNVLRYYSTDIAGNHENIQTENYKIILPPIAENASVSTLENTVLRGTLSGSDPGSLPLFFSIHRMPANGTVSITNNLTGEYIYTPWLGKSGEDSFSFTVSNGLFTSPYGTVEIYVIKTNFSLPTPPIRNLVLRMSDLRISFESVVKSGDTLVSVSSEGVPLPEGLEKNTKYYSLSSMAQYTGVVEICVAVPQNSAENILLLEHNATYWRDITSFLDTDNNLVCGNTEKLSTLIVAYPSMPNYDIDGDSYNNHDDCNDSNPFINPSSVDVCDGYDNNCDGEIDENLKKTFYRDQDGDGYGDSAFSTISCTKPNMYTLDNTDCDDKSFYVNPGAVEICGDKVDQDCDGEDTICIPNTPPDISVEPVVFSSGQPLTIFATIRDENAVGGAILFIRSGYMNGFVSRDMKRVDNKDLWSAEVPANLTKDRIEYYIFAWDKKMGITQTSSLFAEATPVPCLKSFGYIILLTVILGIKCLPCCATKKTG